MTGRMAENERRRQSVSADGEPVLGRDDVLELMAYLLASAELCRREPYYYGSFRLLDGASRLAGRALAHRHEKWLSDLKQEIDEHKGLLMWDREAYYEYLQEATGKVVDQLKREIKT